MKHEAWRRSLDAYPLQGSLLPRSSDVDSWQHLNNGALIGLQSEAQQRWLLAALGDAVWRSNAPGLALLHSSTDFLAESHYPAPLATGVRLLGLGPQGLRLAGALFQHGQCVGLHEATYADWQGGQPQPLPAPLLQRLADAAGSEVALGPAPAAVLATTSPAAPPAAPPAPPPAALPPHPDAWPWQIGMAARFADGDGQRHASDLALARCAEQGRVQFLSRVFGRQRHAAAVGFMVAHVELRWHRRAVAPPTWQLGIGVGRVGERSLAVRSALYDGATCLADCNSVMVVIDHASRRPAALPEAARAALAPYLLLLPAAD